MPGRNCAFFGGPTSQKHKISLFRIPVVSAHESEYTSSVKKQAREKWFEIILRTREVIPELKKRIANNNIYVCIHFKDECISKGECACIYCALIEYSFQSFVIYYNMPMFMDGSTADTMLKPRLHEQFLCDNFYVTSFICSCTWGHLLGFYVTNTFAEKLASLPHKNLPVFMWQTKIVNYEYLLVWLVTYLSHQALCDYNVALKTNFFCRVKKYLLYHLHKQSHLSWKIVKQSCSCKRSLNEGRLIYLRPSTLVFT